MQTTERSSHPIRYKATPNIPESIINKKLCDKAESAHDTTDREHARHTRNRKSRDEPRLSFDLFSRQEIRWNVPPNLQFEKIEQFCKTKRFSTLQSLSNAKFLTEPRLDGESGSEPGVLPPAHSQRASKVSATQLQRPAPADDLSPVWSVVSAANLYISDELDSRIPEKPEYKVRGLSRRFLTSKPVPTSSARSHSFHSKLNASTRLDDQYGQICAGSDSPSRIPRRHVGHTIQHEVPVGTKVPYATQSTCTSDVQRLLVPQTGPVPSGETQLCLVRDTQGKVTLSHSTIPQSIPSQRAPIQAHEIARSGYYGNKVVVKSSAGLTTNTYKSVLAPSNHGRIGLRLGRPAGRGEYVGALDKTTTVVACKSQRAVCSLRSDTTRAQSLNQCAHPITDRQPHSCGLHQQGRWNQIKETTQPNAQTVSNFGQGKCLFDSSILPGPVQLRGGRSVARQDMPGVAPDIYGNEEHLRDVGHSSSRPICIENSSRGRQLCFTGHTRHGGTDSQRIPSPMGLQAGMVIPTTKPHASGTDSPERCPRSVHSDSTEVAQSILESGSTSPVPPGAVPHSGPSSRTDRHENRDTPAGDPGHMFGSMADFGWAEFIKDWSVEEKSLLLSSWRKSTLNTYRPAWNKWKAWCISSNISYKDPSPEQVARYLAHLHNSEGLAFRTILVHKSVIATFTNISGNTDLSSNFFIKHMIKAISVSKEKKVKPPIWSAKNVLEFLENHTPDKTNLYQVSRRSAILLLLASGRRVHDLTLLRVDTENYIDEGNALVFWPSFGSKTDDCNYRQSGWRLKAHPKKNLDCVYWIRQLIKTSHDRRMSGTLTELFLTARGEPKPASRTIIGGWIKSVLKDAGVEAPPGSVRSAVASLNWLEKFPIDQILETSNWKQEHTFRKYYQKEIDNQSSNNSLSDSVSLSKYFKSVR